jgi:hypothetical protein
VARITIDALATAMPPGFPTITSLASTEEGPGTLIARRQDEKTGVLHWEAFMPPEFTLSHRADGSESVIWGMVFWKGRPQPPIDPTFAMEADAELSNLARNSGAR